MELVLFNDPLIHIINRLKPTDVFSLAITHKSIKQKININYFKERTLKEINKRLSKCKDFKEFLIKENKKIYGEFVVQCILEEDWDGHTLISKGKCGFVLRSIEFYDYSESSYAPNDEIKFVHFCGILQKRIVCDETDSIMTINRRRNIYEKHNFTFHCENKVIPSILSKKNHSQIFVLNKKDNRVCPEIMKVSNIHNYYNIIQGNLASIDSNIEIQLCDRSARECLVKKYFPQLIHYYEYNCKSCDECNNCLYDLDDDDYNTKCASSSDDEEENRLIFIVS